MINPELITDKAVEAISLLTGVTPGHISDTIGKKKDIDSLIVAALEEFYERNLKSILKNDDYNDIDLLKDCLLEAEQLLGRAKTNKERAIATKDVMDLRRTIRLKREMIENG